MKILDNIQKRIQIGELSPEQLLEERIVINNVVYSIVSLSNRSHLTSRNLPIGVIMTGFTQQYLGTSSDGNDCEFYAYFYKACENINYAIIETIEIK